MSLMVICPTRGRPARARELHDTFYATRSLPDSELFFALDEDDPSLDDYSAALDAVKAHYGVDARMRMGPTLNRWAVSFAKHYDYLGFVGDDHRFRTFGWDNTMLSELLRNGGGIAYANDLLQGQNLPTQVFMDASIVQALGWMSLPGATHLYLDNTWMTLGKGLGRLLYFPHVIIEHEHPAAGKIAWDAGYVEVNSETMYAHDREVFARWLENQAESDIEKVREFLGLKASA